MGPEILPGILTHTLEEYAARLEQVETTSSKWVHLDFADGQFVPNITVMPHEIMGISTRLKIEAHMMTYRPERYFSDLTVAGVSRILLHREAYKDLAECEQGLKQAGDYFAEVGLVVNFDTPIESYASLPIQVIQCMTIHPGMSGQPFQEDAYATINAIREQGLKVTLAVDGGVGEENIAKLQKSGVSRFVVTSRLFATNAVSQNYQYLNTLITGGA